MIKRLISPDMARLNQLALIHRRAFAPLMRGWSAAEIASLAEAGVLVADDDGKAFALFSLVLDEAELLTIAVDPAHRRSGLATETLICGEAVLAELQAKTIHLEVAADNNGAIALYEKLGYRINGRRKQYYKRTDGPSVDAVTMAKAF